MTELEFFHSYCADRKRIGVDGYEAHQFDHLVRYTSRHPGVAGLVIYTNLRAGFEVAQIQEQIACFQALRQNFEWKVYEFDRPGNLQKLLESQSFVPGEMEVFMICSLKGHGSIPEYEKPPWDVRMIRDEPGVRDVVAVQEQVWGQNFEWLVGQLARRLRDDPGSLAIYCAYADGQPIGTGWTDFPSGSAFPELHGGAVVEAWRGRKVYSDLYRRRLAEALERGYDFLAVDAAPLSRPILEKLGFRPVCTTVPMRFKVA
jgi:GNAT superfamily N-acetyltransferase